VRFCLNKEEVTLAKLSDKRALCVCVKTGRSQATYEQRARGRHPGSLMGRNPGVLLENWRNNVKGTERGSFPAKDPRWYEYLVFISTHCILYGFSQKLEAEP